VDDAEIVPVDPPRDDWLVRKVCLNIFTFNIQTGPNISIF